MSEDYNKLFEEAYNDGLTSTTKNDIKIAEQISSDKAAGVVEEKPPVIEEQPTEEVVVEDIEKGEETPVETVEDPDGWLNNLDEQVRERFITLRSELESEKKKYEEDKRKLENERRAAVGRAAFFQRKEAEFRKQKPPAPPPLQQAVPQISDVELDALEQADPILGKLIRSQNEAIKALNKTTGEQLFHLHTAEEQRVMQEQEYVNSQTQLLYEAFPEWEQATVSPEYTQWLQGMEQHYPGFGNYARSVKHAYGDQNNPGAVDILNLFHSHFSEWQKHQEHQTANEQKAQQIEEERKKRIEQTPPEKKSVAVSPKKAVDDNPATLAKLFKETYESQVSALRGP